ncbi:hypothetical protein HK27_09010 [Acetobacter orientalis]|nr:hypothetical protein HK27_09010 [Acetobacter orientalis]
MPVFLSLLPWGNREGVWEKSIGNLTRHGRAVGAKNFSQLSDQSAFWALGQGVAAKGGAKVHCGEISGFGCGLTDRSMLR